MWRSDEEKVKKLLDLIAQESGKKRLKHLQRLEKIGAEDIDLLKEAPQVLFSSVTDPEEDVWKEIEGILRRIAKEKPKMLKKGLGTLVPHLKVPGPVRMRALRVLRLIAWKRKDMLKDLEQVLMREINTGDKQERALIVDILTKLGVNAKEYVDRLMSIEQVLRDSEDSGADITEAARVLDEARTLMVSKGIDEFLMRAKKSELLARYAERVAVTWRDFVKDIDVVSISSTGQYIAIAIKNEVLLYLNDKEIKWRFTVEGMVTTIVFTSDSRALLIGTKDRLIYLVNMDGNIQWKRRRGGAITAIDLTDITREIFICSKDSNISILSMDGVETSRQWTEKIAHRIAVTENGEAFILIFGDHNIFSYDKNLFQQWKYMGGIWNDIVISGDGAFIFAGSQGGDMVCLSRAGLPVWKRSLGQPIKRVLMRPNTDCFITGTSKGLTCYDRTGKLLWRYKAREPLVDFDATKDGEIIVVITEQAIYLLENREVHKHFLQDLTSSLRTIRTFGIDMGNVNELIQKAEGSFENNDFKKGAKYVSDIKGLIDDAKLERGSELLVMAEKRLSEAKATGVDVSEGVGLLYRAEDLINMGEFDIAIQEARHVLDIARRAQTAKKRSVAATKERRRQEMKKIIEVAVSLIDEAETTGIDTAEAESLLSAAITASDETEFDQCIFIVKELDETLRKQRETVAGITEANFARAADIVEKDDATANEKVKAIDDLNRALKYYESTNSRARVGVCYELLALLEIKQDNPMASRAYYQKAINMFFKIGELEKVAKIIMDMLRELKKDEELPIYEIEDAFLIFKDGRLIAHNTMRLRPDMDRQILGGMLIAIQNFVEEGLRGSGADMLNELRYGKTKILIQRGDFVTLAIVLTGTESKDLWQRMINVIKEIERKYLKVLSTWDGDQDKLWGARKVFEQHISKL